MGVIYIFFLDMLMEVFYIDMIYSTGFGSRPYGVTIGDYNNNYELDIIIVTAGTN